MEDSENFFVSFSGFNDSPEFVIKNADIEKICFMLENNLIGDMEKFMSTIKHDSGFFVEKWPISI